MEQSKSRIIVENKKTRINQFCLIKFNCYYIRKTFVSSEFIRSVSACAFFIGKNLPIFYLENMVFDLPVQRIFHGKNGPNLSGYQKIIILKDQTFMIGGQEYRRMPVFSNFDNWFVTKFG
jgi:hypothetical protein